MPSEARNHRGWYQYTGRSEPLRTVDPSPHPNRPGKRGMDVPLVASMPDPKNTHTHTHTHTDPPERSRSFRALQTWRCRRLRAGYPGHGRERHSDVDDVMMPARSVTPGM